MTTSALWRIVVEEWRYWRRTRLAVAAIALALLVLAASSVSTAWSIATERDTRAQFQDAAERAFKSQPARHPHRMVHYGHYVFRTPVPLAMLDPGIDDFTGTALFLEGHRQNTATFSPFYVKAQAGPLGRLPPSLAYQVLIPLLLVIVGFSSMAREREGNTDRLLLLSDVSATTLLAGKTLALLTLALLLALPLAVVAAVATANGASPLAAATLWLGYAIYLAIWSLFTVAASARLHNGSSALTVLLTAWLAVCVVVPTTAARSAELAAPGHSKIDRDLDVADALRDGGDGHNANDPAFEQLRSNLLAQYDVDSVDALPVNFRGIVAQAAEAAQTEVMNRFAEAHYRDELHEARIAQRFGWWSPPLAMRNLSMTVAGTDLGQHHRFLREGERFRYDFVQALNRVHAESLAYADDIARSRDAEAERRTRVSADNWQRLARFELSPPPARERLAAAATPASMLAFWLLIASAAWRTAARRVGTGDG